MQLKFLKTVLPAEDGAAKICAIAWAPNNVKLAVCTSDRVISLFDDSGEKKDKFSTKPVDPKYGKRSYIVKGLAFSPDSSKLAVGQSDNIIFVYKIGEEWGEKKVICNKFVQRSAVTCLVWLSEGPIVFGQADGKVRAASHKTNKSQTLYATESYVVALAANSRGTGFLSGHADGTIVRYYVTEDGSAETQGRVATHPVPPFALAWPLGHVLAAGCDKRVVVYGKDGHVSQQFDYSRDDTEKDMGVACCSPSGQAVAVGSFDRVRVFSWSPRKALWEESRPVEIRHLYSITALGWKKDGSRVACGSLCGAVQLFESVLKRSVWKGKFELTYVGPSQVLVKPLAPGSRGVSLKSQYGYEIEDVRIMGQDSFLVARTSETLLLGDLNRNLLSEVTWPHSGNNEKFYFDNPTVCLVFNAGELSLVEYGDNDILGSVRTEFMNPHQISVRLNERRLKSSEDNKKLAYLLDLKTICIVDLLYGTTVAQVSQDSKIDWLELNETGHKLLFRDKKMRLTLYDIKTDQKLPILSFCTFVQWVPGSDVVVAQSRNNLCVWYNIDSPDQVTLFPIKGDAVDVVRADGKTEVVVEEGQHQLGYELDEGLLEFGTAIHDNDLGKAILFLEKLGDKPEAEGMWSILANIAIATNKLRVAERCYAALGDVARTNFLRETISIKDQYAKDNGTDGNDCPEVWAQMALLNKQFKEAESIYLEQNQLERALDMYRRLHKWDEALALAEMKGHPRLEELKSAHMKWLLESKQEEKAGEIKEKEGDHETALVHYLRAGLPSLAARLVQSNTDLLNNDEIVAKVASALLQAELYEQAGELYEKVNRTEKAFECYRKARAFPKAIELARYITPSDVVNLEEEWGDHLVSSKQLDAAINHFIEAGKSVKALEAAVGAHQWKKAVQIIQVIEDVEGVLKHYEQLGKHFVATQDFKTAEMLYIRAGMFQEAIAMYNQAGDWDRAHKLASDHLDTAQISTMFVGEAKQLEAQGKLREAEKLYLAVSEPDMAISMYKKNSQYDQMMRLVSQHHADLVQITHLHLAQELEASSDWGGAERHYLAATEWKAAVNMYRAADMWEDAYRVAQSSGGMQAALQVAVLWAKSLGGDSAAKLLTKLNLLEPAVNYACEFYQFELAFELARVALPARLQDIHYKYAMALEDEGKYHEAEEQFIKADKPKEAVLMYIHTQDWESARRVAELHDPESVGEVLIGQSKEAFETKNYPQFETYLLRAQKPEIVVKQYQEAGMWVDALRVCREYLPAHLPALQSLYEQEVGSSSTQDTSGYLAQAQQWERTGDYKAAIECYLKPEYRQIMSIVLVRSMTQYLESRQSLVPGWLRLYSAHTQRICPQHGAARIDDRDSCFHDRSHALLVNPTNTKNEATVVQAWSEAATLANKHLQGREAVHVAKLLGPQLLAVKESTLAAQVFLSADLVKEAIDAFIHAEDWNKAKRVARELEPSYEAYVDERYKESLKRQGRADQLADVDIIAGLDLLAEQNQWSRCLETASQHSQQVLHKYVALRSTQLIQEGFTLEALSLYSKYEAPLFPQNFNIYKRLAIDMFGMKGLSSPDSYTSWTQLRAMLLHLVSWLVCTCSSEGMKLADEPQPTLVKEFEELLLICHYYACRCSFREVKSLEGLVAKLSIALLRHSDIIPADKAFYDAGTDCKVSVYWRSRYDTGTDCKVSVYWRSRYDTGTDCKAVNMDSEAFVFLNHYLDLTEATEEGNLDLVDYTDFSNTDIPTEIQLPTTPYLSPLEHEEVKEWILTVSMDQKISQTLPVDERGLFPATLGGALPCVVSGYPVLPGRGRSPVELGRPGRLANRDDWNKLIMAAKMSPEANVTDVLGFLEEWCGAAPTMLLQ
uniref:Intraflagellar transport protein 172 homolog n=1 Tax=Timema shepardi TaxID=629360 RepID=A0A7R9AZ29_TIMSH|nr:unnamed protein product [Timema shepardi]